MNTDTYSDDEDIPIPPPGEPVFTSSGGGMFAGSYHFTLVGGTFNNNVNTNNYVAAPTVPRDFRMIPIGDLDLRKELVVNRRSSAIGQGREHNCVRRVYSAKIDGRRSTVTVAVYQGNNAEEDWKRDAEMYMSVRHPNIIQICGGASYGNIHATVFHGDLVPFGQFLAPQSPIMTVYIYAYYTEQWEQVADYLASLGQRSFVSWNCTMWIRCSTGRLSVDLVPSDIAFNLNSDGSSVITSLQQAATPSKITEVIAIESLGLAQYHNICSLYLHLYWKDYISTSATVHLGAVTSWPSGHQYEEHVEIALLEELDVHPGSSWISGHAGDMMENGWTRYRANDVCDTEIILWVSSFDPKGWLSQANHVFSHLQITSHLEDYVRIENINFVINIWSAGQDPPPGYLFLCPKEDFRTGPVSFRWPNRPAYWSLDPQGIEALSTEEAERLGFPSFQLRMNIQGKYWDGRVYAGLRQFHQAKGFDPDSQDVARHLGYSLYELCRDANSPFAHVDDLDEAEETVEDADTEDEWADAQSSLHEDSDCDEGSETEEGVGEDSICVGSHKQQAPQSDQQSMDSGYTGANDEVNLKPQTATDPATSGGFIHRIFGVLRHSLVMEAANVDTDPISPFLI